jgi:transposase-like protein
MRDMSVPEQRYQAVLAVLSEGRAVMEVASQWGVNRRTLHRWLARYEAEGLEGLPDRSHRPERCPHQMPAELEVRVLDDQRQPDGSAPRHTWTLPVLSGCTSLSLPSGRLESEPAGRWSSDAEEGKRFL